MRFSPRSCLYLCLLLSPAFGAPVFAQSDGTLHVLRPIMRAEQDKPELCLEFDHPLDNDTGRIQNNLRLEADGKTVPVSAQNIGTMAATLCLSSLDYRREYRLVVTGLRGAENEKLTEPYHLSFTIPDRHPSLAFATDQNKDGVMRWNDNDPVLHGINVTRAKIELYRVTDPALMTEAWRQRSQIMLAPTESAYFARHNGQLLWQGDIVLDDTPNKTQEQKIPLRATLGGTVAPGLYLAVASAPAAKSATETELAPIAATWLLRSNLNVRALRGFDHVYALADQDTGTPLKDVRFILEDAAQQSLAEGKSDADGIAALPLSSGKMDDAATLVGLTAAGDVAFADLSQKNNTELTLAGLTSSITADKTFYAPGETADLALSAFDTHNHPAVPTNSTLVLLRPDRSFYSSVPAPKDQNGIVHAHLMVPAGNGTWIVVWQRSDGTKLAESPLRITTNEDAPRLEISADRAMLAADGDVGLTLKSTTAADKPAPYITGHIAVKWAAADHIFTGWDDYRFGNGGAKNEDTATNPVSFVTDEKGIAQLHIALPVPSSDNSMHAALVSAVTDPAAGAADPVPLRLPVRPKDYIIGIKPAAADGKFVENSTAHFDIIALDGDGKRRSAEGLSYRIYEVGRSFEWYQTEGRWDYKPQPQQRRIAGGPLTIKADGGNGIDWRGAAGSYRLEITEANGAVLAGMDFSAGWGAPADNGAKPAPLALAPATPTLQAGDPIRIRFKLDDVAMITAVIADDHIRKVIHQIKPAGDNEIVFTPEAEWGNAIKVSVDAETGGKDGNATHAAGQIVLPFATAPAQAKTAQKIADNLPALAVSIEPLPVLKAGDQMQLSVNFKNNTATAASYHYVFNAPADLRLSGAPGGTINLAANQSRTLTLAISPTQSGLRELKLDTTGTRNFHSNHVWPLVIAAANTTLTDMPEETIKPQQSWPAKPAAGKTPKTEAGFIFISPQPLYDAPQILSAALQTQAFTTEEIADEMTLLRLWHDVIVQAELLPEQNLASRQRHLAMRLLERQTQDGGFPSLPGETANMPSTAAALGALGSIDLPLAKPGIDQAAEWLKRRLNNNWFDERERPERTAAYMALATTGRLDPASLHYFSDTSGDKNLPPLAALQMASAFAHINDSDKSAYWLAAAHIEKNAPDIAPELLPLLAENPSFDSHDLMPALDKLSGDKPKKAPQSSAASAFLRALWHVQNRDGIWRVSVNNGEQSLRNIFVTAIQEKTALTVRNPGDKPLYLTETHTARTAPPKDDAIARHVYRMNGSEVSNTESLGHDETYLVVAEGPWPDDAAGSILVRDAAAPALTAVSCALGGNLEMNESLKWIQGLSLATPVACEKLVNGIDILLTAKDGDTKTWRIAYLARADFRGTFTVVPTQVRTLGSRHQPRQGRSELWRVQ